MELSLTVIDDNNGYNFSRDEFFHNYKVMYLLVFLLIGVFMRKVSW